MGVEHGDRGFSQTPNAGKCTPCFVAVYTCSTFGNVGGATSINGGIEWVGVEGGSKTGPRDRSGGPQIHPPTSQQASSSVLLFLLPFGGQISGRSVSASPPLRFPPSSDKTNSPTNLRRPWNVNKFLEAAGSKWQVRRRRRAGKGGLQA